MRKIAWVHSHFYNRMGGNKFILEVVKRLNKKDDLTVEIFIQNGNQKFIKKLTDEWIKVHNLWSSSTNRGLFWLFLPIICNNNAKKLQKLLEKWWFDSVITSMMPMNYIATKLKWFKIYQYCYEPFAFFWDKEMISKFWFFHRCMLYALRICYGKLDKIWVGSASKVFTLSKVTRDQIKDVYGRDSIITYEWVDIDFFKPTIDTSIFEKYKDYKIIFHTTDFTPIKRTDIIFDLLPDLVKKIPNVKVLISSTVRDEKDIQKYSKHAEKIWLRKNFEFLWFIDYELLPVYYTLAKISLQPSVNQPQSLPVKEALACWTPVIRWYAKEVEFEEKDGVWFCIDVGDKKHLLEKIVEVVNYDEKTREEIAIRARNLIIDKFTWDRVTDKIYFNL